MWKALDWPPPRMILRYGLTPGCEPTGETMKIEGIEFVEIGPGCFRMGSTHLAKGGDSIGKVCAALGLPWGDQPEPSNEMPVHWVEFRRGFWISRTEVTNEQYFPPRRRNSRPVVYVGWKEAKRYCEWLSRRSGYAVRLPTEAEWECACRTGAETEYCFGDDVERLPDYARFAEDWDLPSEVRTRLPNGWGLFDLHGGVAEWCEDRMHPTYENAPSDGSAWMGGDPDREGRVLRPGSFNATAELCRSASRRLVPDNYMGRDLGFRLALTLPGE